MAVSDIESIIKLFPSGRASDSAKRNFAKGLLVGMGARGKAITDYGFGPKGFGLYVYDWNYNILFYSDFDD